MSGFLYVATHPGTPGFCAGAVDDPAYQKENAKLIGGWIKRGDIVTRVTDEVARHGFREYVEWKNNAALSQPATQQGNVDG